MKYYLVEPEVIVDLGSDTVFDKTESVIRTIKSLHIELESWGGDDLLTNHPVFIVTEQLKNGLEKCPFSGFSFDTMKVTKGEYFDSGYDLLKPVPNFYWLKINGKPNVDDFFIRDFELYISSRVLEYLKINFQVENMDVNRPKDEFDDFISNLVEEDNEKFGPYKTHKGKAYTKEEWEKYQEEQRKNRPPGSTWSLLDDDE